MAVHDGNMFTTVSLALNGLETLATPWGGNGPSTIGTQLYGVTVLNQTNGTTQYGGGVHDVQVLCDTMGFIGNGAAATTPFPNNMTAGAFPGIARPRSAKHGRFFDGSFYRVSRPGRRPRSPRLPRSRFFPQAFGSWAENWTHSRVRRARSRLP